MTKDLRRKHLQTWLLLALLLPAGIIFSWLVIPNPQPVKLLARENTALYPVVMHTAGTKDFQAIIRASSDTTKWQLEWQNKKALAVPSAVIYKSTGGVFDPATAEMVGRIETKGKYIFPFKPDSAGRQHYQLVLYDFIHEQKLDSINF